MLNNRISHDSFIYTDDDGYKIAGRANYLLKLITGMNFGDVRVKSSKKDLIELQKR